MIEEMFKNVEQLRSDAQELRRKARQETDKVSRDFLFNEAAEKFQNAITQLERGLRASRRQTDYEPFQCRILEALSHTYGSLGGTWRDAGDRQRAIDLYDKGNEHEEYRRVNCAANDTYNMLQRLIVRLLVDPSRLGSPDFTGDLHNVKHEIERQIESGRDDSWALADLAIVRFLCGDDARSAIDGLERRRAEATFYESAYNAVATLVNEGLGRGEALGDKLEMFKRFLQREGGIR